MKKITIIIVLLFVSFFSKAQSYVTIPDSHFVSWLTTNVPSAMMGNQMDTSNVAIISLTSINVRLDSIRDLTGIQYFKSLQTLDCSINQLDSLPNLPDSLKTLICTNNYLTELPVLPVSLQVLQCGANYLTWLPALPNSITNFSCEQNQLDTLPALPVNLPNLHCAYNLLHWLPVLPNSITSIDCQTNEMDSLPTLPISLISLNCDNNLLTGLPTLPLTLDTLNCNSNQLTSLPMLPSSLVSLECYSNRITNLPLLPSSLQALTCSNNPLAVGLPILPTSLHSLKCYSDSLSGLPTLPGLLTYLDCNSNLLATLPALPGSLAYVDCSLNHITSLPGLSAVQILNCSYNSLTLLPSLPASLQNLTCGFNPLIDLPSLSSLVVLNCNNATLDSIPPLPATLTNLDCSGNVLTHLPALNSLVHLSCMSNLIDSLPVLPASLNSLYCADNHLTSLPALSAALDYLDCYTNQLASLPALPASLTHLNCGYNLITCFSVFPNTLRELNLYGNPFTCLPNYIPAMDSVTLGLPLCVYGDLVHNPHNCPSAEGLVGFAFTDNNSNCIKDTADFNLINIPVKIYDNIGTLLSQTYTASNGVYNFSEPAGTYTAVIDTTGVPFASQCANPGIDSTVTTTIATPLISDINFDFNCKPGFDVGVKSIDHDGLAFPGQLQTLRIVAGDMTQFYNMHCASGISGTVQIKVTGPVTYVGIASGALTPSITGHIYTYTISDFGTIDNKKAFGLKFTTDTTAAPGTLISVAVTVTPIGGDNDTSNNTTNNAYPVVNSHDPNFKETYPEVVSPTYTDYFTYSIHFQNSGNAPAINIRLADTLDPNLDPSTFQLINYSHANITTLTGNVLNVSFPNIMLVDSTVSADSSKGFIQYRIKAKANRPLGTHIYNTGYIYFDYNEAIVTNTTLNIYRGITGINENNVDATLNVYPNPGNGVYSVKLSEGMAHEISTIEIYNLLGELIYSTKTQSETTLIDLNNQPNGVYIMKVNDAKQSFTQRLIKQ